MLNQGPGGHDLKCNHQGKQCPCLQVSMVDGSLSLAGIWFQVTNLTPVIKISGIFFFFFLEEDHYQTQMVTQITR